MAFGKNLWGIQIWLASLSHKSDANFQSLLSSKMSEILLKCEVSGCAFSTPRLSAEFYGDMVEHLKVNA